MPRALCLLLLAACAGRANPFAPPLAPPSAPAPSTPATTAGSAPAASDAPVEAASPADADLTTLTHRLSGQHPSEDCVALIDGLTAPRDALRRAVDEVSKPPWVGVIAGKCLVRLYAVEEEATITTWLTSADYAGLARLVARELPGVADEPVVLRLGAAALTGPGRDVALEALAADPRPAVQALATP